MRTRMHVDALLAHTPHAHVHMRKDVSRRIRRWRRRPTHADNALHAQRAQVRKHTEEEEEMTGIKGMQIGKNESCSLLFVLKAATQYWR